jgi:hypothetical protein
MTLPWSRLAVGPAASGLLGGPRIGRGEGQRLARQELSEQSFLQRIINAFLNGFSKTANAVPGGWFGLILLGVLVVLAISVVIFWVRPTRGRRASSAAVLSGQARSARDHRREAERLAAAGEFGQAIVEGVRAIAVELEEREILPPRPGRTADELAAEAGRQLPAVAGDLRLVTRLFDDVLYGDRAGTAEGYQLVSRLDSVVRSAKVTAAMASSAGVGVGVPQ